MKAEDLYRFIEDEYTTDMVPAARQDGRAYYWEVKRVGPDSSRIIRISANKAGDITALKLAVNANRGIGDPFLALPASPDEIKDAVGGQVDLYRRGR